MRVWGCCEGGGCFVGFCQVWLRLLLVGLWVVYIGHAYHGNSGYGIGWRLLLFVIGSMGGVRVAG